MYEHDGRRYCCREMENFNEPNGCAELREEKKNTFKFRKKSKK